MSARDPDRALLRRARRALAMQTAAAITASVLVVGLLALVVVIHGERTGLAAELRQTAATEEDVVDPPAGTWIFRENAAGGIAATPGAPAGFPDRATLARVRAGGPAELHAATRGDDRYLVYTRRRTTATVQVVGSLEGREDEQHRLVVALGLGEIVGLLVAAACAVLLARRATAPLGEALGRQRQFVADASHELRTPLTQLHTRAQLLEREVQAGASRDQLTDDIRRLVVGTRQLGEVVDDLLLSSQLSRAPDRDAEVDLTVVAAGVVADHSARARQSGVELTLVPDGDVPSIVRGREAALRRVVTALVDNALSHTTAGGHVTVTVTAGAAPRCVDLVVSDDGTGFDPADAERIFARFARADHDQQRRFGLGLALAREVVAGHGGSITAESRLGHGAAFTVRLPAAPA